MGQQANAEDPLGKSLESLRQGEKDKGGRPPNASTRDVEAAVAALETKYEKRLAALEARASGSPPDDREPVSRAEFFARLMTGMAAQNGAIAYSQDFIEQSTNNADAFYEAYCRIVRRDYATPTEKEIAEGERKRREELEAELAEAVQREARLRKELGIDPTNHAQRFPVPEVTA